jgi:tRNA (guanine37-N1)-methyltransferase
MNLPATALTFLPSFAGLYAGHESLFQPHTGVSLPYVHVHCFSTKSEDHIKEGLEITGIISKMLGTEMRLREGEVGKVDRGDLEKLAENEVVVQDVRDVAPLKRMFCASFRLPAEVSFRKQV